MSTFRKLRFPILIGAGVVAAGVLLYQSNTLINSRQTRGAIGQRDVYRDGRVNAGDVKATPGSAPVATKVLLESKQFRALARNPAFQELLASNSFQELSKQEAFLSLLANSSFSALAGNTELAMYLKSNAAANLARELANGSIPVAEAAQSLRESLVSSSASELAGNAAFNQLFANAAFLQMFSNQALREDLAVFLNMNAYAALAKSDLFMALVNQSAFKDALSAGSAASMAQSALALQ